MTRRTIVAVVLASLSVLRAQEPAAWRAVPSPTTDYIREIQVAGDTVWLLGDGRLFRGGMDGSWSPPIPIEGDRWTTMIAADSDLVYGVTESEQTIQSWRAGHWATIGKLDRCASLNVVLAAFERTFVAGCPYYAGLAFWRANDTALVEGPNIAPQAVAAIGDGDALVLDLSGLTRGRRGEASPIWLHRGGGFRALLWATREHIVIAPNDGVFMHAKWDAASNQVDHWITYPAPLAAELHAIWGRGPNDLYAVGGDGVILRFAGRAWTAMPAPTQADLATVAGNTAAVWAAGAAGTLLRLDAR